MKKLIIASILSALATTSIAADISIPNTFSSGTPAVAAEVNENFSVLATESNSQNVRINALETSSVISAQMICEASFLAIRETQQVNCLASTGASATTYDSLAGIFAEGWQAASIGGTGDANRVVIIFNK